MKKNEAKVGNCRSLNQKVLVSCRGSNGQNNALVVGDFCNWTGHPPMLIVGISPKRYSYQLIKETGCFVVNLPQKAYMETYQYLGSHSGHNEDKMANMNVKLAEGKKVKAPLLVDCPINIECSVVNSFVVGSHEMFIGQVEYMHANEDIVDEKGNIDFSKMDLI